MPQFTPDWHQALFPAGALLALAFFARLQQRSWLSPGAFWLLFWSFCVWLPLLAAPHYYVWPPAIWHILAAAICVYFGSLIGMAITPAVLRHNALLVPAGSNPILRMARLRLILLACVMLGLVGVLIMFQSTGYSVQVLGRTEELTEMAGQLSVERYHQGYDMPVISRILMAFAFAGCGLGGIFFAYRTRRLDIVFALASFAPVLITTLALTTRTTTLMAGVFWLGGYLAGQVSRHGFTAKLFTPGRLTTAITGIAAMAFLALIAQTLRAGKMSLDDLTASYERTATIFFGHLGALSAWLQTGTSSSYSFGAYTFGGIFDQLGLKSRELGIFGDSIEVAPGQFTNVYTVFRCLIEDFSFAGAALALFLIGLLAGHAYVRVANRQQRTLWVLITFYVFTLWSHVTSILNYNSILLAIAIIAIGLCWSNRYTRRRERFPQATLETINSK